VLAPVTMSMNLASLAMQSMQARNGRMNGTCTACLIFRSFAMENASREWASKHEFDSVESRQIYKIVMCICLKCGKSVGPYAENLSSQKLDARGEHHFWCNSEKQRLHTQLCQKYQKGLKLKMGTCVKTILLVARSAVFKFSPRHVTCPCSP
jgi:hypothetical protein